MPLISYLPPLGLALLAVFGCSSRMIYKEQTAKPTPQVSISLVPRAFTFDLHQVPQGSVRFSVVIKNEGPETIIIAHPSTCVPYNHFKSGETRNLSDSYGKSEILLKITKPDGRNITLRDGWMHGFDPNNVYRFTIPPGGTESFYLGWFFQNARGRWENDAEAATVFLDKGMYRVQLIFHNSFPWAYVYREGEKELTFESVWIGEMESEEVSIEVK